MIEKYKFGHIEIDGKSFEHDVYIINGKVSDWQRKEGHFCEMADLPELPKNTEVLVIGNGHSGVMDIDDKLAGQIEKLGIKFEHTITGEAVNIYNDYFKKGKKVVGAFHLTC